MKLTYSACLRLARELLGPTAQLKPHNGGYRIYVEKGRVRTVYGEGEDYLSVINDCFVLESELKPSVLVSPESEP